MNTRDGTSDMPRQKFGKMQSLINNIVRDQIAKIKMRKKERTIVHASNRLAFSP